MARRRRGQHGTKQNAEPTAEADRGRHTGFARHEGLAGGPGSLSLSFGQKNKEFAMKPSCFIVLAIMIALTGCSDDCRLLGV